MGGGNAGERWWGNVGNFVSLVSHFFCPEGKLDSHLVAAPSNPNLACHLPSFHMSSLWSAARRRDQFERGRSAFEWGKNWAKWSSFAQGRVCRTEQDRTGKQRCWMKMLRVFPGGRKVRGIDRLLRDREEDRCVVRKERVLIRSWFGLVSVPHFQVGVLASSIASVCSVICFLATCFSRLCGGAGVDSGSGEMVYVLSISVTRCSAIRVLIYLHSHSRSYVQAVD